MENDYQTKILLQTRKDGQIEVSMEGNILSIKAGLLILIEDFSENQNINPIEFVTELLKVLQTKNLIKTVFNMEKLIEKDKKQQDKKIPKNLKEIVEQMFGGIEDESY